MFSATKHAGRGKKSKLIDRRGREKNYQLASTNAGLDAACKATANYSNAGNCGAFGEGLASTAPYILVTLNPKP